MQFRYVVMKMYPGMSWKILPLVANKQGICSRNININAIWVWAENTVNSGVLLHLHHQTLQFFGEPPVPTVLSYFSSTSYFEVYWRSVFPLISYGKKDAIFTHQRKYLQDDLPQNKGLPTMAFQAPGRFQHQCLEPAGSIRMQWYGTSRNN